MSLIAYVFTKLLRTTLLGKGLKTTVSEHIFTFNMLKAPKHCQNFHDSTFIIFFMTPNETGLENVSVSDI